MLGLQYLVFGAVFIGVLVTVHEAGHFFAAKWAGVKVLTFSIGFGAKMFGFRRGDTMYQIAWIPLGGYVRMAGQIAGEDVSEEDEPRSFMRAPWWKRMIILAAGPMANFLFPVVAFFFIFLGDRPAISSKVQWVEAGLPAARAGILPGDRVVEIDGVSISTFEEIRTAMDKSFKEAVPVVVERAGQRLSLSILPLADVEVSPIERKNRGLLGISSVPRPALLGVPVGSLAEQAGLRTFDRVLKLDGQLIHDELELAQAIDKAPASFEVEVVRSSLHDIGNATVAVPQLEKVTLSKSDDATAKGLKVFGLESSELYVWTVAPGTPAQQLGLKRGDRIVSVDGEAIGSWFLFQRRLSFLGAESFTLNFQRGKELKTLVSAQAEMKVRDEMKRDSTVLDFGLRPLGGAAGGMDLLAEGPKPEVVTIHYTPAKAMAASLRQVPEAIRMISKVLFKGLTGGLPMESVGGPIMLFQVAVKSAEAGAEVYLRNMALLSVNLGLVNLLPIPILDGFGLLAALWEGIRRRPLDEKYRELAMRFGFVLLVCLMVLAFRNDITSAFFR